MSRHTIPALIPDISVELGWDQGLMTFFTQVIRHQGDDDDTDLSGSEPLRTKSPGPKFLLDHSNLTPSSHPNTSYYSVRIVPSYSTKARHRCNARSELFCAAKYVWQSRSTNQPKLGKIRTLSMRDFCVPQRFVVYSWKSQKGKLRCTSSC
jgi:hypothetical protein